MFKRITTAVKAFLSNPLKFIYAPVATTDDYVVSEMVKEGRTEQEIKDVLATGGLQPGGLMEEFVSASGQLKWIVKNLPLIFLIFFFLIALWYLAPILRKT